MTDKDHRARFALERQANRTRERLYDTLSELDHRRHEVMDHPGTLMKAELREHMKPIAITTGTMILSVSSLIGWSVYRLSTRDRRRRAERWNALRRFWMHPERLARRAPPEGTLASQLGRKVLMSAIGYAAVELTKRTVSRAIPRLGTGLPEDAEGERGAARVVVRTLPA